MTTDLLCVSYAKDFGYLEYCLKSVAKFATGFRQFIILVPINDLLPAYQRFGEMAGAIPVNWLCYSEWPGKGMLHHMMQIMLSDQWSDADFFCHMDSDCIFTSPVSPATYIEDGKPYLRYEPFDSLGVRHPGAAKWQEVAQAVLPFAVKNETMRCHPGTFHRSLYPVAWQVIEDKLGRPFDGWMREQQNEFPQTFCEFVTLGNVAMEYFPDAYHLVRQSGDRVVPDNHLQQFWGHGAIDAPQRIWVQGGEQEIVPIDFMKKVLEL